MKMNKKWDKEDIIVGAIIILTAIVAIAIAHKMGIRSKSIFYLLIFIELMIYLLLKSILDKVKGINGRSEQQKNLVVHEDSILTEPSVVNQHNPLYATYQRIKKGCEKIEELNIDTYTLYPPTTKELIEKWETDNDVQLSEGYKNWLRLANGLNMSTTAVIFPLEYVKKSDIPGYENYYTIGSYIGDGSCLLIDQAGKFYKGDHVFGIEESTIEDFLENWVIEHLEDELGGNS